MKVYPSPDPQTTAAFDDRALAIAHRLAERARDELNLLASIAAAGRWGVALAERAGITPASFNEDDCRAIFCSLAVANEPRRCETPEWRQVRAALLARLALIDAHLWSEDDPGRYVGPCQWGPARLASLFAGDPREAEKDIPLFAARLRRKRRVAA